MGRFQDASPEAKAMVARAGAAKSVDEAEGVINQARAAGHFGKDPNDPKAKMIWAKIQESLAHSRKLESMMHKKADDEEKEGRKDVPESAVAGFLKNKPRVSDERFHKWTERKGYHTPSAEAKAYGLASRAAEVMGGGKSKGEATPGVPAEDVKRGIKIEHEHTKNPTVARKIVDDHTSEFKNYYDKKKGLPALEKALENMKKSATCLGAYSTKVRSKGKGRGLGRGKGEGPVGIPVGEKRAGAFLKGLLDGLGI